VIDSLLVANRGEIAVRIFRTCKRLGIRAIGVYSDADAQALHVAEADEAYRIGPSPASLSYLNVEAILSAARQAGAHAIHPGYGFLAENADFAQAVLDAGLVWVGPPVGAMRALGDKSRAKALAEQHGVPLLPGYHGADRSPNALAEHARRIGYPVLIKASRGGGGRGMRVVEAPEGFDEALQAAKREASASFGDDHVLLERYVRRPRHIEVQIFGDLHGHLIHLGERECSIQRRHQKLIEESPSPGVDASLRGRMTEASLRLARAAGYANAGTVEFLLDDDGEFAFLEVNARLQVEHPVTEAVTGLDLVELQLRVASGEPLPIAQADVKFEGHAIEARVIAEDPLAGFLPSSGTVETFEHPGVLMNTPHPRPLPARGEGVPVDSMREYQIPASPLEGTSRENRAREGWHVVRVDTWVKNGTRVSPYYDSLLAKVIAHAADRAAAASTLADALQEVWIDGVADNVDLLLATIDQPAFLNGDLHTGFLDEHRVLEDLAEVPPPVMAAVSALDSLGTSRYAEDPWRMQTSWRLGRVDQPAAWIRAGRTHAATVSAELTGDGVVVNTGSDRLAVRSIGREAPRSRVSVDRRSLTVWDHDDRRVVEWQGRSYRFRRPAGLSVAATAGDRGARGGAGRLTAPMPGRVVKIAVTLGQRVGQNQPLIVLEAMKMEHVIEAPHAGVVTEVCVQVGEQVSGGAQLLTLGSEAVTK
jgi:3-methylcrotonyl-CoA carboxylase alpha subunit